MSKILQLFILSLILISCEKESTPVVEQKPFGVVFISTRDGNNQIYSMDSDGSNQTRISKSSEAKYWPRVSPDNKYIAYTNEDAELWLSNLDGSDAKKISGPEEKCYTPSWSPDSKKLAFASTRAGNRDEDDDLVEDIWIYNLSDLSATQITNNNFSDMTPCFSPDEKKIVFTSQRDKIYFSVINTDYITYREQIYIMNSDGSDQKRLTALNAGLNFDAPVFSPDGEKIAYSVESRMSEDNKWSHIYIMNTDGSNPVRISKVSDIHEHPYWTPDGRELLIDATINRNDVIMLMNIDGTNIRMITDATGTNFTAASYELH